MPVTAVWLPQPACSKSECVCWKSRNIAGTRSTQLPANLSHSESWEQTKPGSIRHVDEQPSPFVVLPSSHCSSINRPSPHFEVHASPLQDGSAWQVAEQPSKGCWLPSSQVSAPS